MDADECTTSLSKNITINRPSWPYENWSDSIRSNDAVEGSLNRNEEQKQECEKPSEADIEIMEAPDHWLDDLDDNVSEKCPIKTLFTLIESPDVSSTPEAVEIKSELVMIMENTLKALTSSHKLFKGSYIMPVGSMTEHSKIYKVDEFDFAVMLPSLAEKDIFTLLLRKDSIETDNYIKELIEDLHDKTYEEVIRNFAKYLKQLWYKEMLCHVTPMWKIQDTSCYSDDVSVAGTMHLLNKRDNRVVDLDVCFWVPLNHVQLSSASTDDLEQKYFLLEHCLDENGFLYAILPRDEYIEFKFNSIRFAMSSLERRKFEEFGPENHRLKCYCFCKCIVSKLVPKFQKRKGCIYCFESIVSSFCLKNIVFYLIEAYRDDKFWTDTQLPNRVVEAFAILSMCMKVNFHRISAYFAPYEVQIDMSLCYNPEKNCVSSDSCPEDENKCILPKIEEIICKIDDEISKTALTNYELFLKQDEWSFAELICRLTEVLCVLKTEDRSEREELVNNTGWNNYGLD